jgi:hypothetical protein|tara:strand:- start:113 stop:298 length:186 start_codon:yes stop_codon:yes gene_type:complete
MRHLNYEKEKVVAIQQYIIALQKDISDLEWEGEYKKADNLKRILSDVMEQREKGEVWYPMF